MELTNIEVEANWCWARKHLQGKTKIVNLYHRRQLIDLIKNKLSSIGEPLLRRFEKGCFGHLLGWKCGISNGQALNALIGRQIVSPLLPEHELWFRINETNIRFSFPEFALVTGLHFGASAFNPTDPKHKASDIGVFQRFCGGKELNLDALWDLFEAGGRPNEATDEDYLKVANLLFAYLFAMGNDPRRKPDNFAWVLVDNLVAWNEFPWGAYCYRVFLHYFKQMKTSGQKYHFYGPAWSLQIWALEAIPPLANNIGKIVDPCILPRCLKWTFKKSRLLDFHELLKTVTECHFKLEASPEEKVQGYCTTSEDLLWQSVGYVEPMNTLNLPADVNRRKGKRRSEPCSSSTNHVCPIREDLIVEKIVEKLVAEIVPKLIIDYLMEHLVPKMKAIIEPLIADQQPRQPQTQPQSLLNHDDRVKSEQPNPHPQPLIVEKIVEKLVARIVPKLIDYLMHHLVPEMKAILMQSLVADQQPRQPQTQLQSLLNHDDRVKSEQPNPHPQPPVYGDGEQPQQHVFFTSEHVEIGGDERGKPHQHNPEQQPPSQLNVSTELVKTMPEDSGIPNVVEAASTVLRVYKRKRARLADVVGEVTTGSSTWQAASPGKGFQRRSLRSTVFLDHIMFDRLRIPRYYSSRVMTDFLNWYDHGRVRSKKSSILTTPWELTFKQNLIPSWFKEIYSSRHSITSQQCDELLNLLIYYRDEKHPRNAFLHDWTVLESMATYELMNEILVPREKEYITNYVEGKLPKQGPKPWSQIEKNQRIIHASNCIKVYGIAQVEGKHWVLYAALLKEQTIMVFDTIGGSDKQEKVHEKAFAHMAANLATLCEACAVYKNCSYAKDLTPVPVWQVKCVHDTPVQINLHDCGVLAMKIMECLTTGESVAAVAPEFCDFYRGAYCYELFSLSTVVSKTS